MSGTGIHSKRIPFINLAFYDVLFTLIGAIIIAWLNNKLTIKTTMYYTLILWALGIFLHLIFCVKTPITNLI